MSSSSSDSEEDQSYLGQPSKSYAELETFNLNVEDSCSPNFATPHTKAAGTGKMVTFNTSDASSSTEARPEGAPNNFQKAALQRRSVIPRRSVDVAGFDDDEFFGGLEDPECSWGADLGLDSRHASVRRKGSQSVSGRGQNDSIRSTDSDGAPPIRGEFAATAAFAESRSLNGSELLPLEIESLQKEFAGRDIVSDEELRVALERLQMNGSSNPTS